MAAEAQHMNLLPSQLITNRKNIIMPNQGMNNMYNNNTTQMDSGNFLPIMADTQPTLLPCQKTSLNTDNFRATRKRSRDLMNEPNSLVSLQDTRISPLSSILDRDTTNHMQQQQSEIDVFLAQHTKKLRGEMEEQRRQQTRMLISTVRAAIVNKLKEKDEAIQTMTKLNLDLQERVKSLYTDNELWRNLAQISEVKANSLRTNLDQILAQVTNEHARGGDMHDDAESCCGSNEYAGENIVADGGCSGSVDRMCKMCGVKESSVLLLPCRHLCLCTMCGSTLQTCPVCKSFTSGSVHVNMS